MTDDIVKRLTRAMEGKFDGMLLDLLPEAADEIKRLRGLITQMVDAYDLRVDGVIGADDYLTVLDLLREENRHD